MECWNEISTSHLTYAEIKGADPAPVAARRSDKLDGSALRWQLIAELSRAVMDRLYPPTGKAAGTTVMDADRPNKRRCA